MGQIFSLISYFLSRRRRVVLDGKSLKEYPFPQGSILGPTLFLLYINELPDDVICNIAFYADDTTLYSKCDQTPNLWQQLRKLLNWNLTYKTIWTGAGNGFLILMLKKVNLFHETGAIDVKMDGSVLEGKPSFKMLGLPFSFKLDWASYIIFIAKTASDKIGALICSMKFLSLEVALYLFKPTMWSCMGYCCHAWVGAPSCYLEMLNKLQKQICKTVGSYLAAYLEPFSHNRNKANLVLVEM